ncbi:MAG: metallophosphatase family protein [Deinococcota bacterium]|jgi:predicted phosphodiesterase|nr:metallophosphatase family protein [Deinococcota bacterium]
MRHLVLSDIHANAVALEAVLGHAERRRWDRVIFLGDLVGYHSQPETVTRRLRELAPEAAILGNHDAILLGLTADSGLEPRSLVERLVARHLGELSEASLDYIRSFSLHVKGDAWEAAHGALREPFEYLSGLPQAQANLPFLSTPLCFVGHTHVPAAFVCAETQRGPLWRSVPFRREENLYRLPPEVKVFFNPGSVGQPRDGLALASYGVFDEDNGALEVYRVRFDIARVQRELRREGYPEALAARLAKGR